MRTYNSLKREASRACKSRGHNMGRWLLHDYWKTYYCICRTCGMHVAVDINPPANGIDIGGEAVALNCGDL